jgi:riboflavin synthase
MFTGIVEYVGEVREIKIFDGFNKIFVYCPEFADCKLGSSIALNGACMTLVKVIDDSILEFDAIDESLLLTNFSDLLVGAKINLEKSLRLDSLIDGHIVTGHIDFAATLKKIVNQDYYFDMKEGYRKYIAHKGSITINGVSLTVSGVDENEFKVSLIPATLNNTNLCLIDVGSRVNIEIDILARYLENLISSK